VDKSPTKRKLNESEANTHTVCLVFTFRLNRYLALAVRASTLRSVSLGTIIYRVGLKNLVFTA